MNKIINIFKFLKIIFKNNKNRLFGLFFIYFILNIIFIILIFLLTNFYSYLEFNKQYSNELSLKKEFILNKGDSIKKIIYSDFEEIKNIVKNDWKVSKNYFLKYPSYLKIKFFKKEFETDILFHVYDFEYLDINISNNWKSKNILDSEEIKLIFPTKSLLILENMILSNLNYENILKYLDWNIYFWKNSFSHKEIIIDKKFKIVWFSDKLAIYSIAIDEKQLKNILPKRFFNKNIEINEINIKFKDKKTLIKYNKILNNQWYNFNLKNEEFKKINKKLNNIYYYLFLPIFLIFLILLMMIVNLNLENSILKNKDIIINLTYLKINKFYKIFIFYLEFFIIFILSLLLISSLIILTYFLIDIQIILNNTIFHYFSFKIFIYFIFCLYFLIFIFSFIKSCLYFK